MDNPVLKWTLMTAHNHEIMAFSGTHRGLVKRLLEKSLSRLLPSLFIESKHPLVFSYLYSKMFSY